MGQQQSGFGGKGNERGGGDADKEKKKKYEAPIPSRIGKRKKGSKGPDTASKLPAGAFHTIALISMFPLTNAIQRLRQTHGVATSFTQHKVLRCLLKG